jgi:hypothetical protein
MQPDEVMNEAATTIYWLLLTVTFGLAGVFILWVVFLAFLLMRLICETDEPDEFDKFQPFPKGSFPAPEVHPHPCQKELIAAGPLQERWLQP